LPPIVDMDEQEGVLACLGGKADGPSNGKEGYWRYEFAGVARPTECLNAFCLIRWATDKVG